MAKEISRAYTFDDILIKPASSDIEPADAKIETVIARGVTLALPFLSAAMDRVTEARMAIALGKLGGLGVLHRNCTAAEQAAMVRAVKKEGLLAGAACGPFDMARAETLEQAGCDVIFIDCAHGHNSRVVSSAREIRRKLKRAKIIVGNVATKEAGRALAQFADGIKVGVGPGSICTTRIVSGVGVPQMTAVLEVVAAARQRKVPVIADGGIRMSGDVVKALAGGASAVMLGNMLAGTLETPGKIITKDGKKYKEYRGMGSASVLKQGKSSDRYLTSSKRAIIAEGVEAFVPYKGPMEDIIAELSGGLRVGMGYIGARKISEMPGKAEFLFITKAGVLESAPHDLAFIAGE
jgi:IMP dehydrogenase